MSERRGPISANSFVETALANPINAEILSRLPSLGLDDCFITAGCLFQAVWNRLSGRSESTGVKDYDVFYFDGHDLSWEAENQVILKAENLFRDLGVKVELKNQARVHLWYEERFKAPYPRLRSSQEGIDRFLICGTCVGLNVRDGRLHAPYGLADIYEGVLRANPCNHQLDRFRLKAEDYRRRWPWLRIVEG